MRRRVLIATIPLLAAVGALAVGAIILLALGASPVEGYSALLEGSVGSRDALIDSALKAVPLLLVGAGICISYRANVINIGGEGQMVSGALLATMAALWTPDLPRIIHLPVVLVAGVIGGACWGAIPGYLKARFSVNEILSTVMLNIVAVQIMNYALRGPLIDPAETERGTNIPQTERLPESTDLPILLGGTLLNLGVVIAVVAAIGAWFLLWRTTIGYRIRAVGLSREAARYAGIPVQRSIVLALTLSGSLAGLAGALGVVGSQSHRFVTDGSAAGFTGSAGFNGIVTALFGGLHPLWTIPSSFLFGGLQVGANSMQRAVQVPSALITGLNGIVVLCVVGTNRYRRRLAARTRIEEATSDETTDPVAEVLAADEAPHHDGDHGPTDHDGATGDSDHADDRDADEGANAR
ncbi:MAG: ABC transporter permease [Actinomycetota bacterium]|nr:ABC transporter permease [Actinomycetota bacterium]